MLIHGHLISKGLKDHDPWEVALYQKLDCSINDIVRNLTSSNVIGTGSSGEVYRVMTPSGETFTVEKIWSTEESGAFASEIQTLGLIRHKNIIRLLGWCSNQRVKLLFYDYLPNGSLSSLLHNAGKGWAEWEVRHEVMFGMAHALAYLHHDCSHHFSWRHQGDECLAGPKFEPYSADFGLARAVSSDCFSKLSHTPHLACTYGYMAPEHAMLQQITEKSDVCSFGVVLLEVLTGGHPLDPTLSGGAHLVQWTQEHITSKRKSANILDLNLQGRADPTMHEMLQTLAAMFLCVSTSAFDCSTMKDVVVMLKEILHVDPARPGGINVHLFAVSVSAPSEERGISRIFYLLSRIFQ